MADPDWQDALDALQAQVTNLQNTVNQQNAQIVAGNAQNAALQAQQAQWLLPTANISRKVETLAVKRWCTVWVAATSDEVHSTQGLLEAQDDSQRLGN